MKYNLTRILLILCCFVICVTSMSITLGIVDTLGGTMQDAIVVASTSVVFALFTTLGIEVYGTLKADLRRYRIQREIDTERAFRELGGDN